MVISIDTNTLIEQGLTIDEFIYLKSMYSDEYKIDNLYSIISDINEDSLQERMFIKITENEIILRSKAINLFKKIDLFYTFLTTFPIKAPSGRYLSPKRIDGVAVEKIKAKWDKLFKGKEELQKKVISVLEAELRWRKKSDKLEFINAIEAWLNQANYEKYEYLLDLEQSTNDNEKWM